MTRKHHARRVQRTDKTKKLASKLIPKHTGSDKTTGSLRLHTGEAKQKKRRAYCRCLRSNRQGFQSEHTQNQTRGTHLNTRRQPPLRRVLGHAEVCQRGHGLGVVVQSDRLHQPPVGVRDPHRQPLDLESPLQLDLLIDKNRKWHDDVLFVSTSDVCGRFLGWCGTRR